MPAIAGETRTPPGRKNSPDSVLSGECFGAIDSVLLDGDGVVVHRLTAAEEGDLRLRAGLGEQGLRRLGLLLRYALAVEQGDEGRLPLRRQRRQSGQQGGDVPLRAEELAVQQGQIVALVDGEAVEVSSAVSTLIMALMP